MEKVNKKDMVVARFMQQLVSTACVDQLRMIREFEADLEAYVQERIGQARPVNVTVSPTTLWIGRTKWGSTHYWFSVQKCLDDVKDGDLLVVQAWKSYAMSDFHYPTNDWATLRAAAKDTKEAK